MDKYYTKEPSNYSGLSLDKHVVNLAVQSIILGLCNAEDVSDLVYLSA